MSTDVLLAITGQHDGFPSQLSMKKLILRGRFAFSGNQAAAVLANAALGLGAEDWLLRSISCRYKPVHPVRPTIRLGIRSLNPQELISAPVHSFWLYRKWLGDTP